VARPQGPHPRTGGPRKSSWTGIYRINRMMRFIACLPAGR
jgi:hypothetical protein